MGPSGNIKINRSLSSGNNNPHKILIWEVNFWGWMERERLWDLHWYPSDHNDRLMWGLQILES
jgi:hypothetical protein